MGAKLEFIPPISMSHEIPADQREAVKIKGQPMGAMQIRGQPMGAMQIINHDRGV